MFICSEVDLGDGRGIEILCMTGKRLKVFSVTFIIAILKFVHDGGKVKSIITRPWSVGLEHCGFVASHLGNSPSGDHQN